jgi:hypothetical protein
MYKVTLLDTNAALNPLIYSIRRAFFPLDMKVATEIGPGSRILRRAKYESLAQFHKNRKGRSRLRFFGSINAQRE